MSFYIISVLFGGVGFFSTQIDTIKITLQLKSCSEEEYRTRIASPFSEKTKQV